MLSQTILTLLVTTLAVSNAAVVPNYAKRDTASTFSIPLITNNGLITETKDWFGNIQQDVGFIVDTTSNSLSSTSSQKYLLASLFEGVANLTITILDTVLHLLFSLLGRTASKTSTIGLAPGSSLIQQLLNGNKIAGGIYSIFPSNEPSPFSIVNKVLNQVTLLVGGIDTGKFTGGLSKFNLLDGNVLSFIIDDLHINDVLLNTNGLTTLVNTKSKLTQFPTSVLTQLLNVFGGSIGVDSNGVHTIACPTGSDIVTLGLGGQTLHINLNQLISFNSDGTCQLGVTDSGSSQIVLGVNLLNAVYTVVDLLNKVIGFAQPDFANNNLIQSITSIVNL